MITRRFSCLIYGNALALMLGICSTASADTLTYGFGAVWQGGDPAPVGTAPWFTAKFEDTFLGDVLLTLAADNLTGSEKVADFYFNVDDPTQITSFTKTSADPPTLIQVSLGLDAYKADGDGFYDIKIELDQSSALMQGLSATFLIKGIDVADIHTQQSAPGGGGDPGPFLAAAHVQGLTQGKSNWAYVTDVQFTPGIVPLPAAVWGGIALCSAIGAARLRSRRAET